MSKIAVSSPSAGTATYTISAPAGSTDRTINLPDSNGTILTTATAGVPVNGPAFSAYQSSAQSVSANTATKIQLQAEEYDTNSCFDAASTYRFTPTVAGYYQVCGTFAVGTTGARMWCAVYKNGTVYKRGSNASIQDACIVSAQVYLNGSTDYIELYGLTGSTQNSQSGAEHIYFQAAMIRSAT